MANLGLNVSDVVNVSVVMSPIAAATRNFGSLLILGDSNVVDVNERLRLYTGLTGVANDFGTSAPEYLAAALYFGQTPQPSTLYIGRWARTATPAVLHGGILATAQQALANFTAVTSGGFNITVNGTLQNVTGVNLSSVSNLNAVASAITAKLTGVTCTWNASLGRFDFTTAATGTTAAITVTSAPGSGTDLGPVLNTSAGLGATTVPGVAAETPIQAVQTLANMSNAWYGLDFAAATQPTVSDYLAVAGYIEGATVSHIFGITSQDTAIIDPTQTTDIASQLKALGYKRTFVQYSSTNPYAATSILGRAFTVNFNGFNTTLTIMFKQEPGVVAESLTETQAAAAAAKNCNVFVNYNNGTAIIQNGTMANGYFFDEVHGTDWLQNDVQTAVFNLLYTSTTKIPQTDGGINMILTTVSQRCDQGVKNGLIAPGVWTAAGFGALNMGDTLDKGYYNYAPPVASQSAADRQARKAPAIQSAIKLAGAVHIANVQINVNR